MKPVLVVITLLTTLFSLAQDKDEILSDIENKYQVINEFMSTDALRQYHTEYKYSDTSKKGPLTFYYNGNELKYILHIYVWGHITYRDEFYIWDDQLFFQNTTHTIRYKDYRKKRFGKRTIENITLTLTDKFYFKEGKLIKCEFKNYQNSSTTLKKIRANQMKDISTACDKANNALEKFEILKKFQEKEIKNSRDLPRSISKTFEPEFNQTVYEEDN